jgi:hypothetical protein
MDALQPLPPNSTVRFAPALNLPRVEKPTADPLCLGRAVQEAIGVIDEAKLRAVASREAGLAFQPKALLAVLSYCYSCEIYGSAEVENVLQRDVNYRRLCQDKLPDANVLRRFRRENRESIESCLAATLRFLADRKVKDGFVTKVNLPQLAEEAKRRIIRAMFIDSMQMDGE